MMLLMIILDMDLTVSNQNIRASKPNIMWGCDEMMHDCFSKNEKIKTLFFESTLSHCIEHTCEAHVLL